MSTTTGDSNTSSQTIIPLEEGWNDEIKAKAIDKLEKLLNGEMESGQTSMFGPR